MLLILLRHGIAEAADSTGDDFGRPLTPEGRKKVARAAAGLQKLVPALDTLASSPKLRARQTAQLARDAWGRAAPAVTEWPELLEENDFAALTRKLWALETKTVLLVGHQPNLENLVGALLGRPGLKMEWKKAGVCAIDADFERETFVLQWLLPPKVLRALPSEKQG